MVASEMFTLGTYSELGRLPKAWFRLWALVLGVSELIMGSCELCFEKSGPFVRNIHREMMYKCANSIMGTFGCL